MIHITTPTSLNIRAIEGRKPISHAALSTMPVESPMTAGLCFWKHIAACADIADTSYIFKIVYWINRHGDNRHGVFMFYDSRNRVDFRGIRIRTGLRKWFYGFLRGHYLSPHGTNIKKARLSANRARFAFEVILVVKKSYTPENAVAIRAIKRCGDLLREIEKATGAHL